MVAAPPPVVEFMAPAPAVGYAAAVPVQYAMPVLYAAPTLTVTGMNQNKVDIPVAFKHPSGQLPHSCWIWGPGHLHYPLRSRSQFAKDFAVSLVYTFPQLQSRQRRIPTLMAGHMRGIPEACFMAFGAATSKAINACRQDVSTCPKHPPDVARASSHREHQTAARCAPASAGGTRDRLKEAFANSHAVPFLSFSHHQQRESGL